MIGPIALLVLTTPSAPGEGPIEAVRASFLRGDLVAFERARALRSAEATGGEELDLLEDLARLVRCLPLGPVPRDHALRAERLLVRLERVRLEALLRDGAFADTPLVELLGPPLYLTAVRDRPATEWVRWPIEQETWHGERAEPIPADAACPQRPGERAEPDPERHAASRRIREAVRRSLTTELVPLLAGLPGEVASKVAAAYVADAAAANVVVPSVWRAALSEALVRGSAPRRHLGLLALARQAEEASDVEGAVSLYHALLADPALDAEVDSRARTRLVGLEEPRWATIVELVRGARSPRASDRPVLDNAVARALYALGRWTELESFGRVWLRREDHDARFDPMTADLLLRLALRLPPAEALAWVGELGPADDLSARLDVLGRVAREAGAFPLAAAAYDRLRLDARAARAKTGPSAAADEARWVAERARVEFAADDVPGFAGLVDDLVHLAREDAGRPLARAAPPRELTRLIQDLLGRLTDRFAGAREHRNELEQISAVLLDAARTLAVEPSRWQSRLLEQAHALEPLAGAFARSPAKAQDRPRVAPVRRLVVLGEVVVPRLPPRLEVPGEPIVWPTIDTYLVYRDLEGRWVVGAPWAALVEARRGRPAAPGQTGEISRFR